MLQDTYSATHETILKYPQYFDGGEPNQCRALVFDGGEPNQCRALVLVPDVLLEEKSTGRDSDTVIE
ncbi:hypothetical protein P8452_57732 [Trifolium repens]|jgi:hypothetical protein|nr:hypothetical protein P8452_57732 [Trifolium repens]